MRPAAPQLREFLHWVRDHSPSAVMITSRAQEDWLGQVRRIAGGRAEPGRGRRVRRATCWPRTRPRSRGGSGRSFGELLDWLDGHPLACG